MNDNIKISLSLSQLEKIVETIKLRNTNNTPNTDVVIIKLINKSDTVGKPDSIEVYHECCYGECNSDYLFSI